MRAHGTSRDRFQRWVRGSVAGLVAGAAFAGAAELTALAAQQPGSPLTEVGSFVIDIVPRWAKDLTIQVFGSNDKLFLLIVLTLAAVVLAVAAGILEQARPPAGSVIVALAGVGAAVASGTRSGASGWAVLPPLAGAVVGVVVIRVLGSRARSWAEAPTAGAEGSPASPQRRAFLLIAVGTAAASVAAVAVARVGRAASDTIGQIRAAVRLPHPRSVVQVPEGAQLGVPGITPLITSNGSFYRVDTALTVPQVDPANWSLVVDGMVRRTVRLSFDELLALGADERIITMVCVSNQVGGNLTGTARWLGIPVATILDRAGPRTGADMVLSRSVDGFTASTPLPLLADPAAGAILAVGMNGQPLPLTHGFPVRMVVPGLYGYVSATKWLTRLTVTTFSRDTAYWTSRGYSARGPIKMSSRIDTPRLGAPASAGRVRVAGVAWAQPVGVARVQVRVDEGPWQDATLSTPVNDDTWVQWVLDWDASPGTHTLSVRATDKAGVLQQEKRVPVAPDGSSGWQQTLVRIT